MICLPVWSAIVGSHSAECLHYRRVNGTSRTSTLHGDRPRVAPRLSELSSGESPALLNESPTNLRRISAADLIANLIRVSPANLDELAKSCNTNQTSRRGKRVENSNISNLCERPCASSLPQSVSQSCAVLCTEFRDDIDGTAIAVQFAQTESGSIERNRERRRFEHRSYLQTTATSIRAAA